MCPIIPCCGNRKVHPLPQDIGLRNQDQQARKPLVISHNAQLNLLMDLLLCQLSMVESHVVKTKTDPML
jgi:hypothetical protein